MGRNHQTPTSIQARARHESGQVLVMFVLLLPVLLGMVAMAVDIGNYASDRRTLQNAADAIAMAAVQELPDTGEALAVADAWALKNGIDPDHMKVSFSGTGGSGGSVPKVVVEITRPHEFAFARIVGVDSADVSARAAATRSSYGGGGQIVPWAVLDSIVEAANNGELITMKYDANNANNGNFGAIRIDGDGSKVYEEEIKYGSDSSLCAISTPGCDPAGCPGQYPDGCAETAPECDGPNCKPKTGNMVGPTADGVDYRMNNTTTACDTFEEAFSKDASGNYRMSTECNPWLEGNEDSLRIIIIPIVDSFGNGSSDDMEVQGFALMYLEGYEKNKCKGNQCEVKGRFIKNAVTVPGLTGVYDPSAPLQVSRLAE